MALARKLHPHGARRSVRVWFYPVDRLRLSERPKQLAAGSAVPQPIPISVGTFGIFQTLSVNVASMNSQSMTFTTNPGHLLYPAALRFRPRLLPRVQSISTSTWEAPSQTHSSSIWVVGISKMLSGITFWGRSAVTASSSDMRRRDDRYSWRGCASRDQLTLDSGSWDRCRRAL
jgi:hypothetical protein